MCAAKVKGGKASDISNMKIAVLGAGSAGCGVADSIVGAMATASGKEREEHLP